MHGAPGAYRQQLWVDEHGTSGDLSEVSVRCECGKDRPIIEADGRVILNITGDDLYYLAIVASPAGAATEAGDQTAPVAFVIRRLALR